MVRSLRDEPVLVLDCQATGASPAHGHLLELGWCVLPCADAPATASSTVVALPPGAEIPGIVRALTGLVPEDLAGAPTAASAWAQLCAAAAPGTPAIVHFARFEQSFLGPLHAELAPQQPFPFELLCTHEIGRRLLPGLPRMGLRALAGYFGHGEGELRRSGAHVLATAFVWRHLVAALAEHGVDTLASLRAWLQREPTRARKREYPMPRERRLQLPDRPGVYRMLRHGGDVLYVGKARSLRRRVNTYFQKQHGIPERTLQLLSQARDLDVTVVATPLEAALLEADEIKRLDPPFNVALKASGRAAWFADAGLTEVVAAGDAGHREGPLGSAWPLRRIAALREGLAIAEDPEQAAARQQALRLALGRPDATLLDDATLGAGVAAFVRERGVVALDRAALLRLGAQLWREHRAAVASATRDDDEALDEPEAAEEAPAAIERPWTAPDVAAALADSVRALAHAVRRAALLRALADATVAFVDDGIARTLVLAGGVVVATEPGPAHPRRDDAALDLPAYDRLRVLATELRRVLDQGGLALVRSAHARPLGGARLRRALEWI
ncbi:MAG: hypothetical protein K1X88_34590 [Nannocystaceae bacterium]|nr:hypothetical protein [Nannocystaceae bacterium]